MSWSPVFRVGVGALCLMACGGAAEERPEKAPRENGSGGPAERVPPRAAAGEEADLPLIVYLGDSLAAGFGLPEDEAFPALAEILLVDRGLPVRTVNAGISGDTTAGGLARVDWLLRQQPDLVVVELGANDGLRGMPPERTEENLRAIVAAARGAGARVLLTGMMVPPNYGGDYARRFEEVFPRIAEEEGVALMPFLLDGVAGEPELNLPDGIHPNAEGHRRIAAAIVPYLAELLAERQ